MMLKKKNISIDDLAQMVQGGFNEMLEKLATKEAVEKLDKRLDKIENHLLAGHEQRIDRLESKMRQVTSVLKIK